MGNNNLHARKALLRAFEQASMKLEQAADIINVYVQSGRLRQTAELLVVCRHTGDSTDLRGDAWLKEADQRIADAIKRTDSAATTDGVFIATH